MVLISNKINQYVLWYVEKILDRLIGIKLSPNYCTASLINMT